MLGGRYSLLSDTISGCAEAGGLAESGGRPHPRVARDTSSRRRTTSIPVTHPQSVAALSRGTIVQRTMSLAPGNRLGPYEIVAPIGAGGMGEVYKARDRRLDRLVAIKVSEAKFSERFEREARAVGSLNHPNICQLYDVGPDYLVMELIEGSPLGQAENLRKLLDMAVQMADGMAAAHAAGIVHRDLKPGNILVTREGRVKILDFGLAKSAVNAQPGADASTLTMTITDPGTTVGTVSYMSPEQARGEPNLTFQSDQFSFGLVLYQMASGKRAFERPSAAETMTAMIREEAEPLPAGVPLPLRWVIERLLAKDPAERYDSTLDLYRELKHIREQALTICQRRCGGADPWCGAQTAAPSGPRGCPRLPRRRNHSYAAPDTSVRSGSVAIQVHAGRTGRNRGTQPGMVAGWKQHRLFSQSSWRPTDLCARCRVA